MVTGTALCDVGAPAGFEVIIYCAFKPLSRITSPPMNAPRRLAHVVAQLLRSPYSSSDLDIVVASEMYSTRSSSVRSLPFVSSISSHLLATAPTDSYTPSSVSPSRNFSNTSVWNILMSLSSPRRFTSKPLSSSSDPSKLKTAYLFLMSLPSSLDAGRIIALYGPSTSNSMLISLLVTYPPFASSLFTWYWSFVHITAVSRFRIEHG
mmetsp:Transcript_14617/g.62668  ORF Transcript_14617/g.62668 Transcript_14617/m.62668 type:complete len:207 (+) Transcript_14617:537-1157(+)